MDLMKQKTINYFMTYATAVIKSRAIPLAEDGLKPVLRRILYSMGEMKLKASGKTVKSAKVVGEVLGKYHPHGDASVYNAMVRLSQDWKMRYPLVYIQGNNGSLNGDSPAAQRYTEVKLTNAGEAMLEDLDKDIINFVPNYDSTTTEPTMLSGIFPNILCNGTEGIAVGVSCSLVPHNLNNVVDLITAHINNPKLSYKEALNLIVGPDFPLGGTIVDGYKLEEIYTKGKGTITLRAKAEIDNNNNCIIFSEFPYLVDVDKIIKSIQSMVLDEGYTDIVEYENHIGKNSCYIKIICQKKANLNKVLHDLYEKTPLEKSININNTIIYNGVPMTAPLLGLSSIYINHRQECITKKAKKELLKQENIIHIQTGLLLATASIDQVVNTIKNSSSKDEARNKLKSLLSIDAEQADAILSLQLGRLTKLDTEDIKNKIHNAEKEKERQNRIINVKEERNKIIIEDLEKLRSKFGDERRTEIIFEKKEVEENNNQQSEYVVLVDNNLYSSTDLNYFKKGGPVVKSEPKLWTYKNENEVLYCFNSDGSVNEEWLSDSIGFFKFNSNKEYILTISKNGISKKTPTSEYKKIQRLCKVKNEDSLFFAASVNNDDTIVIRTSNNKVQKLKVEEIKTSGKLTMGNKISNYEIANICIANDYFYTLNADMQVKRVDVNELGNSSSKLNDDCIFIGSCDEHTICWNKNKFLEVDWNNISIKSKNCNGAKIANSAIRFC